MRRTPAAALIATAAIGLTGVLAGAAFASGTTGYTTWKNFSSGGTPLCAQVKVDIDSGGSAASWEARVGERTLDSGCSSAHTRPAGWTGAAMSYWVESPTGVWELYASSNGYKYNQSTASQFIVTYNTSLSLDCGQPWMTKGRGREWDNDTDEYISTDPAHNIVQNFC